MNPFRAYAMALLLAAALSLLAGRGHCYTRDLSTHYALPPDYVSQVKLLELALALNQQWSAVWSEKLIVDTVILPDQRYCVKLIEPDADGDTVARAVDVYDVVRLIVSKCYYSGTYVRFGVKMLSHSLRCFFYRHARVHVSVVLARLSDVTPEFVEYLRNLVADYRLIADKLAALDASLWDVAQLMTFFYDVADHAERTPDNVKLRDRLELKTESLYAVLNEMFSSVCAVDTDEWFDDGKNDFVSMKPVKHKKKDKKKDKKKKDKKKEKKTKDGDEEEAEKEDEDGKEKKKDKEKDGDEKTEEKEDGDDKKEKKKKDGENLFPRVNELRLIMRTVFSGLMIEGIPDAFWRDIFTETVLVKVSDILEIDPKQVKQKKKIGRLGYYDFGM